MLLERCERKEPSAKMENSCMVTRFLDPSFLGPVVLYLLILEPPRFLFWEVYWGARAVGGFLFPGVPEKPTDTSQIALSGEGKCKVIQAPLSHLHHSILVQWHPVSLLWNWVIPEALILPEQGTLFYSFGFLLPLSLFISGGSEARCWNLSRWATHMFQWALQILLGISICQEIMYRSSEIHIYWAY